MIFKIFKETVARHRMIQAGDRILVAFSGGQDSSALVVLLVELRREMPLEIGLAHFNHRLRPSADEDAAFARSVAAQYGLPFFLGARNVRLYARRRRINLEEAARDLRYAFLRKVARAFGATKIATGHTLTDQAETMLMRLLRGTGLQGLSGIAPKTDETLIRPLLDLERRTIESYLRRRGASYRLDETNLDRRFLRNRIRLEIIPRLEKIEPSVVRHLGRLAEILRDEESLLQNMTETAWRELTRDDDGRISIDAAVLAGLPPALRRRLVRKFLFELCGSLRGVSFEDVESILRLKEGKEKTIGGRMILKREAGRLGLRRPRAGRKRYFIRWDGRTDLIVPEEGLKFRALTLMNKGKALPDYDDRKRALLNEEALEFPLIVRSRRPGDRYRPCGAPGAKKLKEILRAKKIPSSVRDDWPVFISGERIAWVPGLPVADDFKIQKQTKKVFLIERIDKRKSQRR